MITVNHPWFSTDCAAERKRKMPKSNRSMCRFKRAALILFLKPDVNWKLVEQRSRSSSKKMSVLP